MFIIQKSNVGKQKDCVDKISNCAEKKHQFSDILFIKFYFCLISLPQAVPIKIAGQALYFQSFLIPLIYDIIVTSRR